MRIEDDFIHQHFVILAMCYSDSFATYENYAFALEGLAAKARQKAAQVRASQNIWRNPEQP